MKRTLLMAVLLGSSIFASAQKVSPFSSPLGGDKFLKAIQEARPIESHRASVLRRAFNNQYHPDTIYYHSWDQNNQSFDVHTKVNLIYDANMHLNSIHTYERTNSGWDYTSTDTFIYDAASRVVAMETWVAGVPEFRIEASYNADGLLVGRYFMIPLGPSVTNTSWEAVMGDSLEIHTTSNNQITSFTMHSASFLWVGWRPMFTLSNIQYNAQGIPVNMSMNGYTGTGQTDTVFYTNMEWGFGFGNWSEACNITNSIEELYALLPHQRHFLKQPTSYLAKQRLNNTLFDLMRAMATTSNGQISQILFENNTAIGWEPMERQSFTYDGSLLASVTGEEHDGNSFLNVGRSVYAYTNQMLSEERTEYWSDVTSSWTVDEGYSYLISMVQGRPDSIQTSAFDVVNNVYVPNQLATFAYGTAAGVRPELTLNMQVWPNPAQDQISIRVSDAAADRGASIRLTDMQGRLVFQTQTGAEIQQQVELPLQQLKPGIYVLQVSAGQASNSFRLVKQ